jgi:uncharacterized membrane protein YczE
MIDQPDCCISASDEFGARPGRRGGAMALNRSLTYRIIQLVLGLFIFGLSVALMIRAELGLGPWDAFHVGLSQLTGISVGMIMNGVGLLIVLGALTIGVRPGPGTIVNMILIGLFADLLLPIVPTATGPLLPWVYLFGGIALCGLATGMYIGAGFGAGPRDGLMVGLAQKTGWSVRLVRTLLEVSVLGFGWLMGGKIGLGTVAFTLTVGPAAQWGISLFDARRTAGDEGA